MMRGRFVIGFALGAALFGSGAAVAAGVAAQPATQPIYVDGRQVELAAYAIAGNHYVMLRDIGQAVGFNVYWEDGVQVDSTTPYTGLPPAEETASLRRAMVEDTNSLRLAAGLDGLTEDPLLTRAAQVRAEEMAASGVYAHIRPDGRDYATVTDSPYVGENIHRLSDRYLERLGRNMAQAAVEEWAASSAHRDNLLHHDYAKTGVGLARGINGSGEACWYCVQLFLLDGHSVTWVDTAV